MGDGDIGRVLLVLGTTRCPLSRLGTPGGSSSSWGHQDVPSPTWGQWDVPCPTWMSLLLGTPGTPGCPLSHLGTSRTSPLWSKDTRDALVTPSPVPPINLRDTPSPRPVTGAWGHGRDMEGDTPAPFQGHQEGAVPKPSLPKGSGLSPMSPRAPGWMSPSPGGHGEDASGPSAGPCWGQH